MTTRPECETIAVVFRIVEKLPLSVDMFVNQFQSILVVLALVRVRR